MSFFCKVPENITDTMAPDTTPEWLTPEEKLWRSNQLFFKKMDMVMIERKLKNREYTRLCDFYADVLQTSHNIGIYHGSELISSLRLISRFNCLCAF